MAERNRTGRSGTFTRLANVRDKDQGMLSVPADYTTDNAYVNESEYAPPGGGFAPPSKNANSQELADHKLAAEMQKFEQVGAGTVREMQKITEAERAAAEAQGHRTGYSVYNKKKSPFKK